MAGKRGSGTGSRRAAGGKRSSAGREQPARRPASQPSLIPDLPQSETVKTPRKPRAKKPAGTATRAGKSRAPSPGRKPEAAAPRRFVQATAALAGRGLQSGLTHGHRLGKPLLRKPLPLALLAIAGLLWVIAGCAGPGSDGPGPGSQVSVPVEPPRLIVEASAFGALPGWEDDRLAEAMPALLKTCQVLLAKPASQALGPSGIGGTPADWREPCRAAALVPAGDEDAARAFFEFQFRPLALKNREQTNGLVTGYYEAELDGSLSRVAGYSVPLYRAPPAPVTRSRAEIDAGALAGRGLELLWLKDPIDAFILHVQGSGRVRLPDGRVVRVGYAGNNGQTFVAIGKAMKDAGLLAPGQATMQGIRAWLRTHPAEAKTWMHKNPRYIFFRRIEGDGPIGALGIPLSPGRSMAVDPAFMPLGVPVWLDTSWPGDGAPLRRLMLAQDTGSAIKGPIRADFFWGSGETALDEAGRMKQQGRFYLLLPKAVAERHALTVIEAASSE